MNDWLIVANGAPASNDCLIELSLSRFVCVCDGAYAGVKKTGIDIHLVLGDFDSITVSNINHCYTVSDMECVAMPDQSQTDLEKAIGLLDQRGATSIVIVQATGYRVDHTLYNLRLLRRFYRSDRPIVLINDTERISYHIDCQIKLTGETGQRVSILAMDSATISTQGLLYDMDNQSIGFGYKDSISNSLSQSQAVLFVSGGVILVVVDSIVIT